jgi:serine phosphatase RsbU (regulator of sigma subunit)
LLEIAYQKLEITNNELEIKNLKITDSINYAKRIQRAVLPSEDLIKEYFPQSFIYYNPKEIVSGDFYWLYDSGDSIYVATVDCTGHGVPGAFMSMIGNILLNEIVINAKVTDTAEILQKLDLGVIKALKQDVESELATRGWNGSVACVY